MATPKTWKSPLTGYENAEPLPDTRNEDGKSFFNPPAPLSKAYESFTEPILPMPKNGFDFHIYFMQSNPSEVKYAHELHERIRREFPELRIYQVWEKPVGPHPVGMFEVNVFNPQQLGAFFAWMVIWRGPLSVLVHPNSDDEFADHTEHATWMGRPWPLNTAIVSKVGYGNH